MTLLAGARLSPTSAKGLMMVIRDAIPKVSRRWVVALILLVAAAGLLAILSAKKAGEPEPSTRLSAVKRPRPPRSLRVVRVQPANGVISAFEPVIVEVEVTNTTCAPIGVHYSTDLSTRIEVRDSGGRLVGDSPVHSYADYIGSSYTLGPTQSMRSFFIPSAVYQFKKPGGYSVRIMLLNPPRGITYKPSDLGPVTAETTVSVKVLPFDEKRLKARCAELIKVSKRHPYPTQADMMALWSVRHNTALPALKFLATNWGKAYGWQTVHAIRRIGSPESAALLEALKSRKDSTGRAARSAEKADLRIHDSDYFTGWKEVYTPEATVDEFLCYYRQQQWEQAGTLFGYRFQRKYAAQLKDGSLFTSAAGKSVRSILSDPRSRVLRSRKEGKFVIVDVGRELGGGVGQADVVRLRLVYNGPWWHLWDFPGSGSQ